MLTSASAPSSYEVIVLYYIRVSVFFFRFVDVRLTDLCGESQTAASALSRLEVMFFYTRGDHNCGAKFDLNLQKKLAWWIM